ncbi:MAG: hypothetical protein RL094_387 [Candidatus Parcubacteria bacterium]|jgi:hypothetical protein
MSKGQIKTAIEVELRKLNETIDMKIVRGLSYRQEARRHKTLLAQARRLRSSWFSSKLSLMHMF